MKRYSDYHQERITNHPTTKNDPPLSNDYMGMHYIEIESCDDYSYGKLVCRRYKTDKASIYATMFNDVIYPILTEQKARESYINKLQSILKEIHEQSIKEQMEQSPF